MKNDCFLLRILTILNKEKYKRKLFIGGSHIRPELNGHD